MYEILNLCICKSLFQIVQKVPTKYLFLLLLTYASIAFCFLIHNQYVIASCVHFTYGKSINICTLIIYLLVGKIKVTTVKVYL